MSRTQVYLQEELVRRLQGVAAEEGRSAAAVVREAVARYLDERGRPPAGDPFADFIGSVTATGPADASRRHDEVVYGLPE